MTIKSKRFLLVGSLLRSPALQKYNREIEARDDIQYPFYKDFEGFEETQDEEVRKIIQKEIDAGLPEISDGEYSRSIWHLDFFWGLQGVERYIADQGWLFQDNTKSFSEDFFETRRDIGLRIVGPLHSKNHPFINHYKRVRENTPREIEVKLTIPAVAQIYAELYGQLAAKAAYDSEVYKTPEELQKGLVNAWKEFIDEFVEAGGKILQIDDCTWANFSEDNPKGLYAKGNLTKEEIQKTAQLYVDLNNAIVDYGHEKGLKVYTHNCRGNYSSRSFAGGSYADIANFFLSQQNYDRFYLEWDDERAGNLAALKVFQDRPEVEVVVGLLSSKKNGLENKEEILAELKEASKYINKENLYLSHQCGFASCDGGNELTEEEQWKKISQGQEIALEFWGE